MRKSIAGFFVAFFCLNFGASYAQPSVSPEMLENFIRRVCPMNNKFEGESLEWRYQIRQFLDGKWTCDDRAEVAMRIANQFGYQSKYRISKTANPKVLHRYVVVTDDQGNHHEILRSRNSPSED